jgi:hypothetical protein
MYLSSADFSGWLQLKGESRKISGIIISTKYVFFKFQFLRVWGGGAQPGRTPPPLGADLAQWLTYSAIVVAQWLTYSAIVVAQWLTYSAIVVAQWLTYSAIVVAQWLTYSAIVVAQWLTYSAIVVAQWLTFWAIVVAQWLTYSAIVVAQWLTFWAIVVAQWLTFWAIVVAQGSASYAHRATHSCSRRSLFLRWSSMYDCGQTVKSNDTVLVYTLWSSGYANWIS